MPIGHGGLRRFFGLAAKPKVIVPAEINTSEWLRNNPGNTVTAVAVPERYNAIQVTATTPRKVSVGYAWTIDQALANALDPQPLS